MKILHFSKYDRKGGAATAAFDSVRAQREAGLDARLYVGAGQGEEPFVDGPSGIGRALSFARFVVERLPFRLAGRSRYDARSLGLAGANAPAIARAFAADLVVLHNIDGLVKLSDLPRFHCPIVWRTHDMWAMCGTEHYVEDSRPYRSGDASRIDSRLSRWTFRRKQRIYPAIPSLTLCSPSRWLRDELAASHLLRARRSVAVPNGIDTGQFAPLPRSQARRLLGLPEEAPLLLFGSAGGSADPRKGFDLLVAALERAAPALSRSSARLVAFGGGDVSGLPLPVLDRGRVSDREQLRRLYSAADVVVAPSKLENLSLTVLEALACGTPVVAFDIGGMPDMIRDGRNGWLVPPFDIDRLASTLGDALEASRGREAMRGVCRETVVGRFDTKSEAAAMVGLFEAILGGENPS